MPRASLNTSHSPKLVGALLAGGALMMSLIAMLAGAYFLSHSRSAYEARAADSTQTIARILQQNIAGEVGRIDLILQITADDLERTLRRGRALESPGVDAFLERQRLRLVPGCTLRATDATGRVILGTGVHAATAASWADRAFFRALRAAPVSRLWVSNPIIGRMSHQPIIAFVRRYDDAQGRFAGVVSVAVPVSYFTSLLRQASVGPHGIVLLRDANDAFITRVPPSSNPNERLGKQRFSRQLCSCSQRTCLPPPQSRESR